MSDRGHQTVVSPIIEFVPANGFVSESYQAFFSCFLPDYTVQYLSRYGHASVDTKVLKNWQGLTQELLLHLHATTSPHQKVIGVGHSMGGVLLLQAYAQAPEKFSHLCIIDAPIFRPSKQWLLYCAQRLGIIGKGMTVARRAKKRRAHWPSRDAMRAYVASRPFFQKFSQESLEHYVQHGAEASKEGVSLRFLPAVEYEIFRHIPPFFKDLRLTVPTHYLYSAQHSLLKRADIQFLMRNIVGAAFVPFPGGHLYPFEDPPGAAALVRSLIEREH